MCSNIDNLNKTSRGRAVAARRAHNPEVAGSSPVPATEKSKRPAMDVFGLTRIFDLIMKFRIMLP